MKTIVALIAVSFGLCFASVQASETVSTDRTQDLSHWHHHHHHHHHHHGTVVIVH